MQSVKVIWTVPPTIVFSRLIWNKSKNQMIKIFPSYFFQGIKYLLSPAFFEKLNPFCRSSGSSRAWSIIASLYLTYLRYRIVSLELIHIHRMVFKQPANCICHLDFISVTWWRSLQVIEDFRNKPIPACDRTQIIWTNQAYVVHRRSSGGSSKPPGSLPGYPVHSSGHLHN